MSFTYGFKNYKQLFGVCDSNYYLQPFALDTMVAQMVDSGYTKTRRLVYGVNQWKKSFEPNSVFRFAEYPATYSAYQSNLFASNSTFNSSASGWYFDSENATSPGAWASAGGLDGGCVLLDLTRANVSSSVLSSVRLYRSIGTVSEGDVYMLNFSAISNSNTAKLSINFTNTTGSSPKTYQTSTVRKEYSIPVTFNDNAAGSGQYLYFTLHDKGAKVWLDNITLQKVTVNQSSAASVVRFEVNETEVVKPVNLGSQYYKDVYGNIYTGVILLEPYTSKILLFYELPQTVTNIFDNTQKKNLWVFPAPNPDGQELQINIKSSIESSASVRIFSMSGREIIRKQTSLIAGTNTLSINSLPEGVYLIECLTAGGERNITRFIQ
jgi:hypothetical protein